MMDAAAGFWRVGRIEVEGTARRQRREKRLFMATRLVVGYSYGQIGLVEMYSKSQKCMMAAIDRSVRRV